MKFIDVLQNLDKKWRRKNWPDKEYIYYKNNSLIQQDGVFYSLENYVVFADDWEVFEEPKKEAPKPYISGIMVCTGIEQSPTICTLEQIAFALAPYIKKELKL